MKANSRRKKALKTENRLRVALYYSFQLLIDVLIVLVCVKAFSASFNFAHDVFVDSAKDLRNHELVVVKIAPDSSTSTICDQLYDSGVIKNKYVMMAKIKLSEVGGNIKSGSYTLSPSMKYSEIIGILTGGVSTNKDVEEVDKKKKINTPTDAEDVIDNSAAGAGTGEEGDDFVDNSEDAAGTDEGGVPNEAGE